MGCLSVRPASEKYRELAGLGDAEANAFLKRWDASVLVDNVQRLFEFERTILDHSHQRMAIIDAMELRTLRRFT